MIATYALCGFSNFASLGITFGSMCECYWSKLITARLFLGNTAKMIVIHLLPFFQQTLPQIDRLTLLGVASEL